MKITLESTTRIVKVNGMAARIWEGKSAKGVPIVACITRIAVEREADNSEFERELKEHAAPSPAAMVFDTRFFVDDNEF